MGLLAEILGAIGSLVDTDEPKMHGPPPPKSVLDEVRGVVRDSDLIRNRGDYKWGQQSGTLERMANGPIRSRANQSRRGFYVDPRSNTGWSYQNPQGEKQQGVARPQNNERVITNQGRIPARVALAQQWSDYAKPNPIFSNPQIVQWRDMLTPSWQRPSIINAGMIDDRSRYNDDEFSLNGPLNPSPYSGYYSAGINR